MRLQCQRGSHGCGRAMLIAIFSHAAFRCPHFLPAVPRRDHSVSEDRMAAEGAMLTAIFSHAADRTGLSEGQFEFKSFTIIVARNRTGSRRK